MGLPRQAALLPYLVALLIGAFGENLPPPNLGAAIDGKYVGKAFTLRGFYTDDRLYFDKKGSAVRKFHPGSWTTAIFGIERAKVLANKIELRGFRIVEEYYVKQSKLISVRTQKNIVIEIDRDATEPDALVLAAFAHILLQPNEQLVDFVPDYWKAIVSGAVEYVPQESGPDCPRIKGSLSRGANGNVVVDCAEHAKVKSAPPALTASESLGGTPVPFYYSHQPGLTPPRPVQTPSPEYSQLARALRIEGTTALLLVVGTNGHPDDIQIIRPIGTGLDDEAVATVRTWRFKPALLNGTPVPVRITVETSFHLY